MQAGLSFSHVGFYVQDIDKMEQFYQGLLGFFVTDRGTLSGPSGEFKLVFLSRDPDEHHQIVLATGKPDSVSFNVINQISLRADSLDTLRDLYDKLAEAGASDIQPVTHGNAISVYLRDPEGNRLELFIDTPWYVDQPMRVPVDFRQSNDELMQSVEAHARQLPGFQPRSQWRARMVQLMGME
ncbi:VOC family protein [Eoetvoesiella caeni]|uniref:Catechol 2,3-dioxygenase-like lactoylglutathione lyase family enzyme n=1 Tax=Eoetvoesiella caeni TaxID=645616 RepID=A0A366HKU1_9BURK|nr:VOC family protein [Eoetvoesiella caeni]MCI2807650.1 VOC family protein [Eoetvoesiella caeni]NYT52955.1 VOC family protein [Eoetvoesiella caeni]RBP42932.1 catechol 2,3-dioxygenase-like lactoylglutathione lyase family enzyme [Eoetvoesiella caeni]